MDNLEIGQEVNAPNGERAKYFGIDRENGEVILGLIEDNEVKHELKIPKSEFEKLNPTI